MSKVTDDIYKIHKPKPKYKIINEIASRWSPRYFSDKQIPKNHIKIIFEAARWAPSAYNHQPWYFYYTQKDTDSYKRLFALINEYNKVWANSAPLLIVACFEINDDDEDYDYVQYDLGAAVISLILQARSLGYYARQMALFDKAKVKTTFKIPKKHTPFIIIAMGKIGDYKKAPQAIIDRELKPHPRKEVIYSELK